MRSGESIMGLADEVTYTPGMAGRVISEAN
jgi:hypothetical protein